MPSSLHRSTTKAAIALLARAVPLPDGMAGYFFVPAVVPLLGSFITEPAAMTLAALILSERIFSAGLSERLKYATLGVLFVNVPIGATLTPYAAPPVLMVAAKWGWDLPFMLAHIGWKAALAVLVDAAGVTALFALELAALRPAAPAGGEAPVKFSLVLAHLAFLAGVVLFAHHPPVSALHLFLAALAPTAVAIAAFRLL